MRPSRSAAAYAASAMAAQTRSTSAWEALAQMPLRVASGDGHVARLLN